MMAVISVINLQFLVCAPNSGILASKAKCQAWKRDPLAFTFL